MVDANYNRIPSKLSTVDLKNNKNTETPSSTYQEKLIEGMKRNFLIHASENNYKKKEKNSILNFIPSNINQPNQAPTTKGLKLDENGYLMDMLRSIKNRQDLKKDDKVMERSIKKKNICGLLDVGIYTKDADNEKSIIGDSNTSSTLREINLLKRKFSIKDSKEYGKKNSSFLKNIGLKSVNN
ncbi:MAG: hypothetical protein MJ252_18815 [archaeon]|nr:hypothetical protein [archaeon]